MSLILITGGAGFFGSILKKELIANGHKCLSIDLEPDTYTHPDFTAIKGDIRDLALLEKVFSQNKFDAIFHCAAFLAHEKKDLKNLWSSNVDGTKNIADMANKYGIGKVVFTSTNCLWAKNFETPVKESEKPEPIEIYGKSKLEGEKILLDENNKFYSIIFRCPTIMDEGRLGLLSILFQFIDENRKVWIVGDGNNKYQFIYAKDLALAFLKALDYDKTNVFNIGSNDVKSFNDVYNYVITNSNSKSKLVHLPKKLLTICMDVAFALGLSPLGPYQSKMISSNFVFDTSKIKAELGFQPTLKNEEMLMKAYKFYHENKKEIKNRKNVSAHNREAKMGIIKILKWFS